MSKTFDPDCRLCPRLATFLDDVALKQPGYHARPVPPFGARRAQLLIVGLAPGMHGANRTGRPFTGDHAGIMLYETLHRYGYANKPQSLGDGDGLRLRNCRITNAVKCLPPQNKPIGSEVAMCNQFLAAEINALPQRSVVLALGGIAHRAVIKSLGLRQADFAFAHRSRHRLADNLILISSYHCSRYNTQTRRLTGAMFDAVFADITQELDTAATG